MKKLRWQLIIILLTGLVVGVLLINQQQPMTQPTIPTPSVGGVYTEGLVGSLIRLNPILHQYNLADREVNRLLFSSLLTFDARGLPQLSLAESWGRSIDGTIYTFTLRSGVVWHDGEPLTAEDVVFTIDLLRNAENLVTTDLREFWNDVEVKGLDDTTIQFRLPEAFAPFLDYLTFAIVPKHLLSDMSPDELIEASFNLQPVGSGPYRFDHLIVEDNEIKGIVLSLFDEYFGKTPFIEKIVFRYYPNSSSALQAYQMGEIQGISQVSEDVIFNVLNEPNLATYTSRRPEMYMVFFNLKNPEHLFFQDEVVRRALYMGLNRQWMVDHIMKGQAILANGPLFPGSWAYFEGLENQDYDPEGAIEALKDAGYVLPGEGETIRVKDEKPLEFHLIYPDETPFHEIAEEIRNDWLELGVNAILEAQPYSELVSEHLDPRTYEAALINLNMANLPDPDPYPFWDQAQATGGQNYTQWDDHNASEYLEQARITNDFAERTRLYRNFQVIFTQQLPALPLFYPVFTYAIDHQVQGVQVGPLVDISDRFNTISDWFLVAGRVPEVTSTPP